MATITPSYGTITAINIDWTLIGLSANRQSDAVDNSSNLMDDALIGGKFLFTANPTTSDLIGVYAYGSYDGTTFIGNGVTGSEGTYGNTLFDSQSLDGLRTVQIIPMVFASLSYIFGPVSLVNLFNGIMPIKWGIIVDWKTGAPLDTSVSTNNEIRYTPLTYVIN